MGGRRKNPKPSGSGPFSLLLVDRHDDQRFAQPIDKRGQKNWRSTQSDPFLPTAISVLHPVDGFILTVNAPPSLLPSRVETGFLARAPPFLTL